MLKNSRYYADRRSVFLPLIRWAGLLIIVVMGLMSSRLSDASAGHSAPLLSPAIDLTDKPALQRGAKWYMNYCAACHSLRYLRYSRLARDLGMIDHEGQVAADLVRSHLVFTGAKIGDHVLTAIPTKNAADWFGITPPDLTLAAKLRGADWLYTYLLSFYHDPARPFASNNWLFPDVAMPNILAPLQGKQMAKRRTVNIQYNGASKPVEVIEYLQLVKNGRMTQHQFQSMVTELVGFLVYAAEPIQVERQHLGIWVLLFLMVLLIVAYQLKKLYWRRLK